MGRKAATSPEALLHHFTRHYGPVKRLFLGLAGNGVVIFENCADAREAEKEFPHFVGFSKLTITNVGSPATIGKLLSKMKEYGLTLIVPVIYDS